MLLTFCMLQWGLKILLRTCPPQVSVSKNIEGVSSNKIKCKGLKQLKKTLQNAIARWLFTSRKLTKGKMAAESYEWTHYYEANITGSSG